MSRKILALLIQRAPDPEMRQFATVFLREARANDCDVVIFPSVQDFAGFELLPLLKRLGVRGIFLIPSAEMSEAFVKRNSRIPMICGGPELGKESVGMLLQTMGLIRIKEAPEKTENLFAGLASEGGDAIFRNFNGFLRELQKMHSFEELRAKAEDFAAEVAGKPCFTLMLDGVLPELKEETESPTVYFFSELKGAESYSVLANDKAYFPGEDFRTWILFLAIGIQLMKERELGRSVRSKLEETTHALAKASEDKTLTRRIAALAPEEQEELRKVEKLLNENLFTYHFQPIVSAESGEIYSYEALMRVRPDSGLEGLNPYLILKYAELTGRLGDVEKATFLNVTAMIDEHADEIGSHLVFINSLPGVQLLPDDYVELESVLWEHSKNVVVEITEQTEADEHEVRAIKRRYEQLGIQIALDDYGTGYSNVMNLLQYMPAYVKIDRSLLADIDRHPKKQRFVREIIDFCHDNSILALAEGVETWKELRAVIRMGADLIQGYYTAMPSAELISEIDPDIKREIVRYQEEYRDGRKQQVYMPDESGRINLASLQQGEHSCLLVGKGERIQDEVVIAGRGSQHCNAHLEVAANYRGRITLENVFLTGTPGKPCIEIGENSDVTLVLTGGNQLDKGGIRVPNGSRLTIEGMGNLKIDLDTQEPYGIGNDLISAHGDLFFDQNGEIVIDLKGRYGIGIGSGMGGKITILRGKFRLGVKCDTGVGIGSFHSKEEIAIQGCEMIMDLAVTKGVAIGSVEENVRLAVTQASVTCDAEGTDVVAYGTITGKRADIHFFDTAVYCTLRGECIIGVGSLGGATYYRQERATLRVTGSGAKALAFGGYGEEVWIDILDSDTEVDVSTAMQRDTMAPEDHIRIKHGRNRFMVNGYDYHHEVDHE